TDRGQVGEDGGKARLELGIEDDGAAVRVVEEVAQLVLDVAEVDVDRHGPELERTEHRLHPWRAVVRVDRDVVARMRTELGEAVRDLVRSGLELREAQVLVADDERG